MNPIVESKDRVQPYLLPDSIDDQVAADCAVRDIHVPVDELGHYGVGVKKF